MAFLIGGANSAAADTAYSVANSCRFEDGDTASMSRTTETPTDPDKYTFSIWVKIGNPGIDNSKIFSVKTGSYGEEKLEFNADDLLWRKTEASGGETDYERETDRKFRDPGAWYHILIAYDSSDGTAGDRMKMYVNGVRETSFGGSVNPDSSETSWLNTASLTLYLGNAASVTQYFDGYMAEVAFVDGVDHAVTDFGEFDEDSPTIWKPKDISSGITWGNNGFYLDFEDSSALGNDVSGNNNDFSVSNLAAVDQCTDSPTNNFPTMNPLIKPAAAVPLTEGNLIGTFPGSWTALPATFGLTAGKWYFEAKCVTGNSQNTFMGVVTENQDWDDSTPYNETTGVVLYGPGGRKTVDGSDSEDFFGDVTSGDIIGVQLDLDSDPKTILFFLQGTATPDTTPIDLPDTFDDVFTFPYFVGNSSSATANWEVNFGNPPYANSSDAADENGYGAFEFAPDSGYLAICTKNLGSDGG